VGGGGILRIERQKHDLIGVKRPDRPRRAIAEGMPVTHGDKSFGFDVITRQHRFQRVALLAGLLEDRRTASDLGIDFAGDGRAALGNQPGQWNAENPGQADDGGIGKQIAQEGLHRFRRIRPAQIEQNNRKLHPRIRFNSCSTWAIGVSGRMP
jgi:hypothetical protein